MDRPLRIGAVRFLNSKPLIYRISELAPESELCLDVPSRLAERLAAGELDVALIPSIEYFRGPGYAIVPGMAIAAHGPAWSVKLYCRRPIERLETVALDEGSRTSAALLLVLLAHCWGLRPVTRPLPLGVPPAEVAADAVLVIGDRAMRPLELGQVASYDLGQLWLEQTGLPFVFAMWVTGAGADLSGLDLALRRAKRLGLEHVSEIAARYGPPLGLSQEQAERYLTDHIRFDLGPRQIEGLLLFYRWAAGLGLAPKGVPLVFYRQPHLAAVH